MSDKHCRNCRYSGRIDGMTCCDYIGITEHKRPCAFMDGCEVWEPAVRAPKKKHAPVVSRGSMTPEMEQRALELYRTGMADPAIARDLGVSATLVRKWRNSNKLPSNFKPHQKIDYDAAARMYQQGKNDKEIAAAFGADRRTIATWRQKHGLPVQSRVKREAKGD